MPSIVFASSNKGKIAEVTDILTPLGITVIPQTQFNIPDADETGLSFIENAILKARHCAKHTSLPALADDSGLCVPALNGAPGIYSARFSGEHGNDQANMDKLITDIANTPTNQRQAYFQCALALMRSDIDPMPTIAEGQLAGEIIMQKRGNSGFGYNPIFLLPYLQKTLAEIDNKTRNQISHRALALQKLTNKLSNYYNAVEI